MNKTIEKNKGIFFKKNPKSIKTDSVYVEIANETAKNIMDRRRVHLMIVIEKINSVSRTLVIMENIEITLANSNNNNNKVFIEIKSYLLETK